jgi:hypothetical protein
MSVLLTAGLISLGSGLLSGIFGSGESEQEKAVKDILDKLEANEDFFKQTPFTKDELFQTIMPAIQQSQKGAADVAAGRLGAAVGETGNVAGGQGAFDYYLQSLAPVIAQGEQNAAGTYQNFVQMWSQMDAQAKQRFMQSLNMQSGLTSGLPNMTKGQEFITNFLSGAQIGATGTGNVMMGNAMMQKGNNILEQAANQVAGTTQP